jgi:putative endopeptidase
MKLLQFFAVLIRAALMAQILALPMEGCRGNKTEETRCYFETANMDKRIKPGQDFYQFANGNWLRNADIPSDMSAWGSFYTLYAETTVKQRSLLQEISKNPCHPKGSDNQKVGDFFFSGMDTVAIEKAGMAPLQGKLKAIYEAKDYHALMNFLAEDRRNGFMALMAIGVVPDEKRSSLNILSLGQSGLSLPEKGYYNFKDAQSKLACDKLVTHARNLFLLCGENEERAAKKARMVLAMESKISAFHLLPEELRNPEKNYNKMSVNDLQALAPELDWKSQFQRMGLPTDTLNVCQPLYYKGLCKLLASESLDAWKAKVAFDCIHSHARYLSKVFRDEDFEFHKQFSGAISQRPRWKIMVAETDRALGDLLGKGYVQKYFPAESRDRMLVLVNNLQTAFSMRIQNLTWMSNETKQKALYKLSTVIKKIGYPDDWKTYENVEVSRTCFFGNLISIWKNDYHLMTSKLNKPVDKTEWQMTPPTINAYYNPSINEIVFPAGILQFPFFDPNADDAINYGAIGMVIGHEMTHGFDDQGRQYDGAGNLNNWWTDEDGKEFEKASAKLVAQYSTYTVLDSLHLNGSLTLGENIADLGGLSIAYDAFKLTEQGRGNTLIDGFTPDQRFFLGFAQVWREVIKPELAQTRVRVDPHSPACYRVNGTLAHFGPFYKAFQIKPGDAMYLIPEQQVRIW